MNEEISTEAAIIGTPSDSPEEIRVIIDPTEKAKEKFINALEKVCTNPQNDPEFYAKIISIVGDFVHTQRYNGRQYYGLRNRVHFILTSKLNLILLF